MTRDRARLRLAPEVIQRWPGREVDSSNKVPTAITYVSPEVNGERPSGTAHRGFSMANDIPCYWGFMNPGQSGFTAQWFKLFLDEGVRSKTFATGPTVLRFATEPTAANVRRWFEDFLRFLYRYIDGFLRENYLNGRGSTKLEYIFSIPTSWDQTTANHFEEAVNAAGFRRENTSVKMTEVEAAAVYTVQAEVEMFKVRLGYRIQLGHCANKWLLREVII
jgi:hypothetical protein